MLLFFQKSISNKFYMAATGSRDKLLQRVWGCWAVYLNWSLLFSCCSEEKWKCCFLGSKICIRSILVATWWPATLWVINSASSSLMDGTWTIQKSQNTWFLSLRYCFYQTDLCLSVLFTYDWCELFFQCYENVRKCHDWQLWLAHDWSSACMGGTLPYLWSHGVLEP